DHVAAEVLYPTLGLALFAIEDPDLQAATFHRYNEWLAEYCGAAPDRLFGIGMIPTYDIDVALAELETCVALGMRGGLIWQAPHPDLPFSSDHYERLWAAAEAHAMPLSMHTLTGFNYAREIILGTPPVRDTTPRTPASWVIRNVQRKLESTTNNLAEVIFSGVFERYPGLRLVIVENEVGWLPFYANQWDYF